MRVTVTFIAVRVIILNSPRAKQQRQRRLHRVAVGVIPMDRLHLQRRAAPSDRADAAESTCTMRVNTSAGTVAVAMGIHHRCSPALCRHVERRDHDHVSHQCPAVL